MMCIVYLLNKHSSGAYMFVAYKILYDYKIKYNNNKCKITTAIFWVQ